MTSLFKEPIGIVLKVAPNVVEFENKKNIFRNELSIVKHSSRHQVRSINLRIKRKDIFEESFKRFESLKGEELRGKLRIEFEGEEGMDAGGLTREWFQILSKEIFNENYALFTLSASGNTYQPNKNGLKIHSRLHII
jgi:hypothetical protein